MHRFEWPDNPSVEFHLEHGEWIRLFAPMGSKSSGYSRPDEGSTTRYPFVDLDWARKWPTEEVWRVNDGYAVRLEIHLPSHYVH
jgi:hypothetical protein